MSADKWSADFRAISESFQNATTHYGTDNLLGLILGRLSEKQVKSVVFILPESNDENQRERIKSHFPSEVDVIGLAKFSGTPDTDFTGELTLKLSVDDLKNVTKNRRKIATANPLIIDRPTASMPRNLDTLVQLRFFTGTVNVSTDKLLNCVAGEELAELVGWPAEDAEKLFNDTKKSNSFPIRLTFELNDKTISYTEKDGIRLDIEATIHINIKQFDNADCRKLWSSYLTRILVQIKNIFIFSPDVKAILIRSFSVPGLPELVHVSIPCCSSSDVESKWRYDLHKLLNLPINTTVFHANQSLTAVEADTGPRLISPHEFAKFTPAANSVCAIVRGTYAYHHYRQDGFEDSGWGCAYRSFQTIWSWLRHRRFTDRPVPTHREIQQCLVNIGDKRPEFVGSREWIGSLELSYCLESMLSISSRILLAKAGGESIAEHARALIFHFESGNAPIMIGGGQYAYTILGIDYDQRMGKCQYLVLDPHYTGSEDLATVLAGGWCAWKPTTFWDKKCFYNLLLPINPTINEMTKNL